MSEYLIQDSTLTAMANAIRGKTGTSESLSPSQMASKITNDLVKPTGNINITNTSSTDVSNYATAQVVDSNLVAENIKKDVTILGVTGTHEGGGSSSIYKFYTQEGTELTTHTVAGLADAYYYTKNGGAQQRVGGRIFHINSNIAEGSADKFYVYDNISGLVASKTWGGYDTSQGGLGSTLGLGKTNTATCITNGLASESGTIYDWVQNTVNANSVGGCNDWYIGTTTENDMLRSSGLVDWFSSNYIWSSSEDLDAPARYALYWYFDYGFWASDDKDGTVSCFAVRSF